MSKKKQRRKCQRKNWHRSGKFNRHHIKNKCRGGRASENNLLLMDTERHNAWHFLFKNMSFLEVAELLKRCVEVKNS